MRRTRSSASRRFEPCSPREMSQLRPIGFWRGHGQDDLPTPQSLVRSGWISNDELTRLITYLRGGETYETYRGLSYCRLGCAGDLGCRDFTDGVWVWPEGLFHYPEEHEVLLPQEFIAHCRANSWKIPPNALNGLDRAMEVDYGEWVEWARDVTRPSRSRGSLSPTPGRSPSVKSPDSVVTRGRETGLTRSTVVFPAQNELPSSSKACRSEDDSS